MTPLNPSPEMGKVKRYGFVAVHAGGGIETFGMIEQREGGFVSYPDHAALIAQRDELVRALKDARAGLLPYAHNLGEDEEDVLRPNLAMQALTRLDAALTASAKGAKP